MADETLISWADMTFNPWVGCTRVSPACDGCYAAHLMETRMGRVQWGGPGIGAGTRELTSVSNWRKPKTWNKKASAEGKRPFVFCSSLADVFDNEVPSEWRLDLFDLIRATPNLIWLLLTKRPQNIVKLFDEACIGGELLGGESLADHWPRNAAIGTTVEDQQRADINVPALLAAKAALSPAFAFLSCEPLLGPINLRGLREFNPQGKPWIDALSGAVTSGGVPRSRSECGISVTTSWTSPKIDWVITGGETDQGAHKARPTHPDWFRSLRDQCAAAGIPFHHKQNGEWIPWIPRKGNPDGKPIQHVMQDGSEYYPGNFGSSLQSMIKIGKKLSGRELDGVTHDAFPEVRAA
ncbi:DUF5131 family protein [Rhizobium mongolense]